MTLHPMAVMVTLEDGESLKLGIRTSNFKADGTRSTGDSHGWFKVDHFRLQRIDAEEIPSSISAPQRPLGAEGIGQCYDLLGRQIATESLSQKGRSDGGRLFIQRRPDGSVVKLAK